jgi:hypothetical protein
VRASVLGLFAEQAARTRLDGAIRSKTSTQVPLLKSSVTGSCRRLRSMPGPEPLVQSREAPAPRITRSRSWGGRRLPRPQLAAAGASFPNQVGSQEHSSACADADERDQRKRGVRGGAAGRCFAPAHGSPPTQVRRQQALDTLGVTISDTAIYETPTGPPIVCRDFACPQPRVAPSSARNPTLSVCRH